MKSPVFHIETEEEVLVSTEETAAHELVVFNDDINTFEHVIVSLMQICGHTLEQADQCAHFIHYRGQCAVMDGTYEDLVAPRFALTDRGLSAEIV